MTQDSRKLSLTLKIFIGMLAGILTGALLQALFDDSGDRVFNLLGMQVSTYGIFVEGIFNVGGTIFINSLKMLGRMGSDDNQTATKRAGNRMGCIHRA